MSNSKVVDVHRIAEGGWWWGVKVNVDKSLLIKKIRNVYGKIKRKKLVLQSVELILQSVEKGSLGSLRLSEKECLNEHGVFPNVNLEGVGRPSADSLNY